MKREVSAIGKLDKRIRIDKLILTSDGQGGKVSTWEPLIETTDDNCVWAKVEPINSYERNFSQKLEYQRTHKITIRLLKELDTDMKIVYNDVDYGERTFQIKAFRNVDERRFYIEIDAQENVGT